MLMHACKYAHINREIQSCVQKPNYTLEPNVYIVEIILLHNI